MERYQQLQFQAVVSVYNSGVPSAEVIRLGATLAEGPYKVANHVGALSVGQRVVVQDVTGEGGFVVVARL